MDNKNIHLVIVASQYNKIIVDRLLSSCLDTLDKEGVNINSIDMIEVPGAFEIPVAVKKVLVTSSPDAVITLGAVIRGETPHFDVIVKSTSMEILRLSTEHIIPVIFGVLTVDNIEQAMDRSGDEESNKGAEAALTAINMVKVLESVKSD